jgi:hypothetical protein
MGRTLFLGDSHAAGYYFKDRPHQWEHNYGDSYSKLHNKEVIVYALPGATNKKYPIWLKSMLDRYDDIDEVFVQSTYWNRWLMGASKKLNYGDGTTSDMFLDDRYVCPNNDKIKYYTDWRATDDFIEIPEQCRSEIFEQYKGIIYDEDNITPDWAPFHEKYSYTRLYHEALTHLQYRDYNTDMFVINALCKERGIKWHLWTMNERVYFPKYINLFGPLTECSNKNISAETFLKSNHNISIEDHQIDGEHYPLRVHDLIAEHYFTFLKENNNG